MCLCFYIQWDRCSIGMVGKGKCQYRLYFMEVFQWIYVINVQQNVMYCKYNQQIEVGCDNEIFQFDDVL